MPNIVGGNDLITLEKHFFNRAVIKIMHHYTVFMLTFPAMWTELFTPPKK